MSRKRERARSSRLAAINSSTSAPPPESSSSSATSMISTIPSTPPEPESAAPAPMPPSNAIAVGDWLARCARTEQFVTMRNRGNLLLMTDGEEHKKLRTDDPLAWEILKANLRSAHPAQFVVPHMGVYVDLIREHTGLSVADVLPSMLGDVTTIVHTIGVEEPTDVDSMRLLWLGVSNMVMPRYYTQVGKPLARVRCGGQAETSPPWRVSYPHLLDKVITQFSMEPILLRGAEDGDPVQELRPRMVEDWGLDDPGAAAVFLNYVATGSEDTSAVASYFDKLDKVELDRWVDQHLPLVKLAAQGAAQLAWNRGQSRTLYGRTAPARGDTPACDLLYHILVGTAWDIVNVCAVSLANAGAEVVQPGSAYNPRVKAWISKPPPTWEQDLQVIANLAGPLMPVALKPGVSYDAD